MKLGRLLIAGLIMAGSTSASAGVAIDLISIHDIQTLKLKAAGLEDGKIKTTTVKASDVEEILLGREATNDEKLSAFVPCPIDDMLGYGGFYIGVWDKELEQAVGVLEHFDIFNEILEFDNGRIKKVEAVMDGDIENDGVDVNLYATVIIDAKIVDDSKGETGGLDGENCVSKVKTKAIVGYDDTGADEFIIESGKIKAGQVKDGGAATQIFD